MLHSHGCSHYVLNSHLVQCLTRTQRIKKGFFSLDVGVCTPFTISPWLVVLLSAFASNFNTTIAGQCSLPGNAKVKLPQHFLQFITSGQSTSSQVWVVDNVLTLIRVYHMKRLPGDNDEFLRCVLITVAERPKRHAPSRCNIQISVIKSTYVEPCRHSQRLPPIGSSKFDASPSQLWFKGRPGDVSPKKSFALV